MANTNRADRTRDDTWVVDLFGQQVALSIKSICSLLCRCQLRRIELGRDAAPPHAMPMARFFDREIVDFLRSTPNLPL